MEIDRIDMEKTEHLAMVFKTLSNPNRLAIFQAIRNMSCETSGECQIDDSTCVSAVGEVVRLPPSTLSEHLKELKRAGLIDMKRKGKWVYCSTEKKALDALKEFLVGV